VSEFPSPAAIQAWARLLRASQRSLEIVEERLKARNLPPLVWYDVLHELAQSGEEGLRPYELESRMLLKQYHLSRLLARMDRAGAVERVRHARDRRGQVVRITSRGRELRRRMWAVYGPAIVRLVQAPLVEGEPEALARLLRKLIDGTPVARDTRRARR
jgi:DNA-binding MarR family transcriptional regulator